MKCSLLHVLKLSKSIEGSMPMLLERIEYDFLLHYIKKNEIDIEESDCVSVYQPAYILGSI